MKKLQMKKLTGTSNYFPEVELTNDELYTVIHYGQILPGFLRQYVVNHDIDKAIKETDRLSSKDGYREILNRFPTETVTNDLADYLSGQLDRMDLIVKYGLDYKKLKGFFVDMLGEESVKDWNKRKKISQKETTISVYGVEHTAQLEAVKAKQTQTTLDKYGVENVMYLDEFKEKYKNTMLETYGVDHNFKLLNTVSDWKQDTYTRLTKDPRWKQLLGDSDVFHTRIPLSRRDFVITELKNDNVEQLLMLWKSHYGKIQYPTNILFTLPFDFSQTWLKFYDDKDLISVDPISYHTKSKYEELVEYQLQALGVEYLKNHRKALSGLEIDFFIPSRNLGIEINPNSTHNSNKYAVERCGFGSPKQPSYHFHKYTEAKKRGIKLLQLFEYDLEPETFQNITWPRLKSQILGYDRKVYARQTTIRKINTKDARKFINTYHAQGYTGAKDKYGMYVGTELVAVATFGKMQNGSIELKRLAYKTGIQIVGGTSKFIAHYFRQHPRVQDLYSFSDNNYGDGRSYDAAGAEFIRETGPSLIFISPTNSKDRYSWQISTTWSARQGVVANDNGGPYDGNVDEYIETHLNHRLDNGKGYDRVYTSGSKLWKFSRK